MYYYVDYIALSGMTIAALGRIWKKVDMTQLIHHLSISLEGLRKNCEKPVRIASILAKI
jgi:hypothetical protein